MTWLDGFRHWLAIHTGTVNETGPYYGFLSGAGGDLAELAIIGALISIYKRHNCHEPRCWRIGHYPVDGTPFHACRKHHPALTGKPRPGHMHRAYHAARGKPL